MSRASTAHARSSSCWPAETHDRPCPTMGDMLMGNKKAQRITVGIVIGVIVVSLALSLISTASATP